MEGREGDGGSEKSAFRWLNAARFAVAAVVIVLIVVVIVNAIKVVLRPDTLRLSVVGGSVYSTPLPADQAAVALDLTLRAENPSGRVRMYFLNITIYLFNNTTPASTSKPFDDSIIAFQAVDEVVAQQMSADSACKVEATNDDMTSPYFDMLYAKRDIITDVTMRVDGKIVTEVRSGINRTNLAMFYCWPLFVGGYPGDEASNSWPDVPCTHMPGSQSNE
ncbi:hypothetical protein EJB05_50127, partial [Eragrostis curvula]